MAETIKIGGELESMATGKVVAAASAIKDKEKNRYQDAINDDVVRHENEIHGTNGINDRLNAIEAAESITYEGGSAQIAQASDFDNPDATKRAKIPTVGAVLDGISEGVFNLTAKTGDSYASLQDALTAANTAIPANKKKGGMQLSFAQSSDNKYVQYRCKTQSFSANVEDWAVCDDSVYVGTPDPEWIKVVVDADRRILGGIKRDGSIEWYKGVPASVKTYVVDAISAIMSGTSSTDIDGINKIIAFLDDFSTLNTLKSLLDEKVDVEEGKSLIPDQFIEQSKNPEFIQVLVDADRRMIESTTPTGKKTFYGDVVIKEKDVLEEIDKKVNEENGKSLISTQFIQEIEYPEYIECHTDNNKRVLYGVDKDGDFVFGCGVPKQIQKYVLNTAASNKIIRNNILFRKRYTNTSNNVEEVIDVTERKYANMVAIGVFSSDYLTSNKKYNVYGSLDGSIYTSLSSNINTNTVYELTVDSNIKYIKIITTNISSSDSLNIGINVWSECNQFKILVAASNSSGEIFKREAHFICDGVNDEVELDEAVVFSSQTSIIGLSNGAFYIDSFIEKTYKSPAEDTETEYTDYGVITNFSRNFFASQRTIVGVNKSTNDWGKGTRIYVRESAFTGLPNDVEPYVIGCPKYGTTGTLIIKHLAIRVENNQHKVVCINGQRLGAMIVDSVSLSAGANAWSETLPVEGCVGLRGVMGDCNGTNYYIAHTYAGAFYEGFQLGGEHLVMIECGGRFNYYCYTFGNYDYGSAYNSGQVTDSHPLTLINCCDEGSRALPKFVKSGMYGDGNVAAKQQIDLIGFNMEVHTASLQGAIEVTPGAFCGTIDFVAYGNTNTSKSTPGPNRRNRVDVRFWASDNDGKYFRTTNAAHAETGSTTERLGYWAQKMQKYYDTDLNKMLVCTSEDNQTWRDFSGNIINN